MQLLFLMKTCEHGEILCKICHPKEYKRRMKANSKKLTKKEMKEFMDAVELMKNGELKNEQI